MKIDLGHHLEVPTRRPILIKPKAEIAETKVRPHIKLPTEELPNKDELKPHIYTKEAKYMEDSKWSLQKPMELPEASGEFTQKTAWKYLNENPIARRILRKYAQWSKENQPQDSAEAKPKHTPETFEKFLSGHPHIAKHADEHSDFYDKLFKRLEETGENIPPMFKRQRRMLSSVA